ncbi:MAG TPA: GFA family protein [Actinomycetospora sp.]|nr:GFA family protein [Actinomycetospora sp.]
MSGPVNGAVSSGRCLCGTVAYRVVGPLRSVVVCHCRDCRRWHGRAAAMTCADRGGVAISGEEALRWFRTPDGPDRGFCARCGSSLFWAAPGRGSISIAAGTLDAADGLRTVAHIWCDHAPSYETEHVAGVERHARGAPARLAAPPER